MMVSDVVAVVAGDGSSSTVNFGGSSGSCGDSLGGYIEGYSTPRVVAADGSSCVLLRPVAKCVGALDADESVTMRDTAPLVGAKVGMRPGRVGVDARTAGNREDVIFPGAESFSMDVHASGAAAPVEESVHSSVVFQCDSLEAAVDVAPVQTDDVVDGGHVSEPTAHLDVEISHAGQTIGVCMNSTVPQVVPLELEVTAEAVLTKYDRPCAVCLDDELTDPVVVPCAGRHIFCRQCLCTARRLECPVCRDVSDPVALFLFELSKPESGQLEWMGAQMVSAAEVGAVRILELLLEWGYPVDHVDQEGLTPLMHAASSGQAAAVRRLLKAGAERDATTDDGVTALLLSAEGGHLEAVQCLVDARADLQAAAEGETSLHVACASGHLEVVRLLLDAGAGVNAVTDDGFTPLHLCTMENRLDVMQVLLQAKTDVEAANSIGETALILAGELGVVEVVQQLLQAAANVQATSRLGYTALHVASSHGHLEVMRILVEAGADQALATPSGKTTAHLAAADGHVEALRYLSEMRVDCLAKSAVGQQTPLHLAAFFGHADAVRLLLELRAGADTKMSGGQTPLHLAASQNGMEVVRCLMQANSDLELTTSRYSHLEAVALIRAAQHFEPFEPGQRVIVVSRIVCPSGHVLEPGRAGTVVAIFGGSVGEIADVEVEPIAYREERLRFAALPGQISLALNPVELMCREPFQVGQRVVIVSAINFMEGALLLPGDLGTVVAGPELGGVRQMQVDADSVRGQSTVRFAALPRQIAAAVEQTPLQIAIAGGCMEVAASLLAARAQVNMGPHTPLHEAAEQGHADFVRSLLEARANPQATSIAGWTPLGAAAVCGQAEVVRVLIEDQESVGRSVDFSLPLRLASYFGHLKVVSLLLEHRAEVHVPAGCQSALHLAASQNYPLVVQRLLEANVDLESTASKYEVLSSMIVQSEERFELGQRVRVASPIWCQGGYQLRPGHGCTVTRATGVLWGEVAQVEADELGGQAKFQFGVLPGQVVSTPGPIGVRDGEPFVVGQRVFLASTLEFDEGRERRLPGDVGVVKVAPPVDSLEEASVQVEMAAVRGLQPICFTALPGQVLSYAEFTPLQLACASGALQASTTLIEAGARLDTEAPSPIHLAAERGHTEAVQILIDHRANLQAKTTAGMSALGLASAKGHMGAVSRLVAAGVDVDEGVLPPVWLAARRGRDDVLRRLLEVGAAVDVESSGGRTALHVAAVSGHVDVVRVLVEHTANLEARTSAGITPLGFAAANGHKSVVAVLLVAGARREAEARSSNLFTLDAQRLQHTSSESGSFAKRSREDDQSEEDHSGRCEGERAAKRPSVTPAQSPTLAILLPHPGTQEKHVMEDIGFPPSPCRVPPPLPLSGNPQEAAGLSPR
eukprot:TRINITY_DN9455_c0_g1_i3.p1 TRINITY_DN9455_c0_g1~~TRINITY_DN9455_c0_g1_i3.p1  ORF type:complete len:1382 (-),score=268.97 TRINITY_DN9455_c0_g1_i3:118-4263(-)